MLGVVKKALKNQIIDGNLLARNILQGLKA